MIDAPSNPTLFGRLPVRLLLSLACAAMVLLLGWYTVTRAPRVTHGFVVYYAHARMLLEGEDFRKAYDYEYFNSKLREYGIHGIADVPKNFPTNALLLVALAWMSPAEVKIILSAVSFAALLVSLVLLLRAYGISLMENLGMGLSLLFLVWRPIYDNLYLGQIYAIVLLLFCLSLVGVKTGSSSLSSISLSLAFLFKGHGLVPLLWLAVRRRFKVVLLALSWIVIIILCTLPFFGIETWLTFSSNIVSTLGSLPTDAGVSFQTVNSLICHLFTYDAQWLPNPVATLPAMLVRTLSYILNLSIIVYVLVRAHQSPRSADPLSYAAAVAAGVVTAPLAEEYAFVLFLPLAIGLAAHVARKFQRTRKLARADWTCLLAILVLAIPIRYKYLHYDSFPLVILAYPKLYAGVTLLLCFGRMVKSGYFEQTNTLSDPPRQ